MKFFLTVSITLLAILVSSANCTGHPQEHQKTEENGALENAQPSQLQKNDRASDDIGAARDSVKLAFDAYSNAIKNNDFEAMYSTISPAYQNGMIFQGRFALGSGASSDKAEAILEGAFDTKLLAKLQADLLEKKRPITDQDAVDLIARSVIDRQKFFTETWTYIIKSRSPRDVPDRYSDLSGLKIENNVASAKVKRTSTTYGPIANDGSAEVHTQTTDLNVYFIKSKGKWVVAYKAEWNQLKQPASP